jgi:hypothetical protein
VNPLATSAVMTKLLFFMASPCFYCTMKRTVLSAAESTAYGGESSSWIAMKAMT